MTTFERIKKVAEIRKISLRDVAKKAGMKSETAIYRYNQSMQMELKQIKRLHNRKRLKITH